VAESNDWSSEALLEKIKAVLPQVNDLRPQPFVIVEGQATSKTFRMEVFLTERFAKRVRKAKLLKPELGQALASLRFGYDPQRADPTRDSLGVFKVDPANRHDHEISKRLYERFLFSVNAAEMLHRFGVSARDCIGAKVTSEKLLLLGCIECHKTETQWLEKLVLVDLEPRLAG